MQNTCNDEYTKISTTRRISENQTSDYLKPTASSLQRAKSVAPKRSYAAVSNMLKCQDVSFDTSPREIDKSLEATSATTPVLQEDKSSTSKQSGFQKNSFFKRNSLAHSKHKNLLSLSFQAEKNAKKENKAAGVSFNGKDIMSARSIS